MSKEVRQQIETTAARAFLEKDELAQTTAVSLGGAPQLRRWERSQFLGQFPEQVLYAATEAALRERPSVQRIVQAVSDQRCQRLFIKAALIQQARPLLQAAKKCDLPVTVVHSPEFRNDTAIVLTTSEPHDKEDVFIKPRE
ncbi:MAG: YueI family protein [Firmicutes bacterium]|nr:YueI family protein [Bacillota bacterium]